jgi:hypothetical protein
LGLRDNNDLQTVEILTSQVSSHRTAKSS